MKAAEKYKYWAMLADYDIDTAQVLIDGKRWVYVAYMCQQALERQLKGMYVYYVGKEAPKSHNLPFLFESVCSCDGFPEFKNPDLFSNECKEGWEDFLTELMYYYISDYPFSYKRIVSRFINAEMGQGLYGKSRECIAFLRSLQPKPETVNIEVPPAQ